MVHLGMVLHYCPSPDLHCPPLLSQSQGSLPGASLFWLMGSSAKQGPGGEHQQKEVRMPGEHGGGNQ